MVMEYPKVSFLLLNWNGFTFTQRCIKSLLKTNYPNFEIVVLDNGSSNKEAEKIMDKFHNNVKVVKSNLNMGYAAGMNMALSNASGDLIMVLNNDMEFGENWLMPLVEKIQSDKKIALCQPKIKDLKNKYFFEYAAACGGFIDIFGYPFARGRVFSYVEKDNGQYDTEIPVAWAGVFLAKKKVLEKVGFFDPMYFTYAEDVDLCWRIYGHGYKILSVPSSVVYHYGGGIIGKNLPRKMFYIHRNHLILLIKNWPTEKLILLLLPRIMFDMLSIVYYAVNGLPSFSLAILKAYVSLCRMLPLILASRRKINESIRRRAIKNMPIFRGSLVWEYFMKHRQTYDQLLKHRGRGLSTVFLSRS